MSITEHRERDTKQALMHQEPRLDLVSTALGLVRLHGGEVVGDIGCGNGPYLREVTGARCSVDLSIGMVVSSWRELSDVKVVVDDIEALPLADG